MLGTIIGLASGALGGNLAGSVLKNSSMGTLWNSVIGIVGGGLGATILGMVGIDAGAVTEGGGMDIMSIVGSVGSGGVGGGVLLAIIGAVKGMMNK